ncbi:MAG: MarR family winged helix-turn-helix transcriptional regulator [Streptosporangiaceae bacterium]
MSGELDASEVAGALRDSIGLLVRRLRQMQAEGDLTLPESSALARLDRDGPATPSALAKREQISPQSMGATLAALETRGLVARRPDPADGRSVIISLTEAGRETVQNRRAAKTEHLAEALATTFSRAEREQLMAAALLIERLAESL